MVILDFFEASIKLGIPMAALSWFLFSWLYNSGELDREDDRRAIKARVKKMKKFYEKEKRQKRNYF